jgi:hypothetical protein
LINIETVASRETTNIQYIKKRDREKYKNNPKRFVNLNIDKEKSFKIKKLFNELPTMENLKKRFPKVYLKNFKCPRCEEHNEDISHLWNCRIADNDVVFIQRRSSERLRKLLNYNSNKFHNIDDLIESLFPFSKTVKNLKSHNKASADYYSIKPEYNYKLDYTYIWDEKKFMDDILRGWIPKDLFDTILSNMKSPIKKFNKDLIFKWMGKVNNLFFNHIWIKRNEDMINWEKQHNISKQDKKKKRYYDKKSKDQLKKSIVKSDTEISRKNNREYKKRAMNGKKKNTVNYIDDLLYIEIKTFIFGFYLKFTLE